MTDYSRGFLTFKIVKHELYDATLNSQYEHNSTKLATNVCKNLHTETSTILIFYTFYLRSRIYIIALFKLSDRYPKKSSHIRPFVLNCYATMSLNFYYF